MTTVDFSAIVPVLLSHPPNERYPQCVDWNSKLFFTSREGHFLFQFEINQFELISIYSLDRAKPNGTQRQSEDECEAPEDQCVDIVSLASPRAKVLPNQEGPPPSFRIA